MITIQELIDKLTWFDFLKKIKVICTLLNKPYPIYANNVAALAGGLKVNDVYRTSAGDVKVVI